MVRIMSHIQNKPIPEGPQTFCESQDDSFVAVPDIDECSEGSSGCTQQCTNTPGSFSCSCRPGYTLTHDQKTCQGWSIVFPAHKVFDNRKQFRQKATRSCGSLLLPSFSEFLWEAKTFTAADVDECGEDNGGCAQLCQNEGGTHSCSCQIGFTIAADAVSCQGLKNFKKGIVAKIYFNILPPFSVPILLSVFYFQPSSTSLTQLFAL